MNHSQYDMKQHQFLNKTSQDISNWSSKRA
jgi:hypothetical protein